MAIINDTNMTMRTIPDEADVLDPLPHFPSIHTISNNVHIYNRVGCKMIYNFKILNSGRTLFDLIKVY